ncbi:hypothetical protein K8354_11085 [Polaribacter litorisediminis]|uniref:hypothetical protein n=1 Tax=Polaribacter litorisediminis TaxID=1908341 RepID=UPI001CC1B374|nr:hypothetical protein [Polaribacter litorisediminis]UAM96871.1 hypothetical protein K8354_11085 [Polaribacter litorisediminis]
METALKIQNSLLDNQENYKKLVEISKIVNSREWNATKFKIILSDFVKNDKLIMSDVKKAAGFSSYYVSLYFEEQKYWLELWSSDDSVKLYLCCKDEDKKTKKSINFGHQKFEYETNWGS